MFYYSIMPALETHIIEQILKYKEKFPVFVETGTLYGETILAMEDYFDSLHTIEIYDKHHHNAKDKYTGSKISFHLGDSTVELGKLLQHINQNTVFFLDGHYSGGDTASGVKNVPLYEELRSINELFPKKAIIIIDDYRLFKVFDGNIADWRDINKETCLDIVKDRIQTVYHLPSVAHPEDRLIIELKEI